MGFLDPYAVDGATITAGQLRRQVFATTKGATGVDGPEDLEVVAVPGSPGVAGIMPGGGVIGVQSRRESYSVTNPAMDGDALVEVPTAGSSGATHFIIVEVTDPEYHGQESEAGATALVVASLSGRTRPFLPLARIELEPGETFGVTSTVVDLRRVAVPRKERHLFAWNVPRGVSDFVLTSDDDANGQAFPNFLRDGDYLWWVDIPLWATRVTLMGQWMGVRVKAVPGRHGRIWVRIGHHPDHSQYAGHIDSHRTQWNLDDVGPMDQVQREFWIAGDERPVPPELRGTRQPVVLRGLRRALGETNPVESGPRLNEWSSVAADVEFLEGPA